MPAHRPRHWRVPGFAAAVLALILGTPAFAQQAGIHVPAGASVDVATGELRASCLDLTVAGNFRAGGAQLGVLDTLQIASGGQFDAGSAQLRLGGDLLNAGSFSPATSRFEFTDDCGSVSTVLGIPGFHELVIRSTTGKRFQLEAEHILEITGGLQIVGAPGLDAQVVSNPISLPAYIRLGPDALLDLQHVNLPAGNVFLLGLPPPPPALRPQIIPAGGSVSLLLLALLTAAIATARLRRP